MTQRQVMGIGIWASGRPSRAEPATGRTFHESQTLERNQEAPLLVGLPPGDSRSGREDERGDRDRLGNAAAAVMTPPIAAASAADDTYRRLRRDGSGGRGRLCEGDAKGRIHFRILGPTHFLESLNQLGPRDGPIFLWANPIQLDPFVYIAHRRSVKLGLRVWRPFRQLGLHDPLSGLATSPFFGMSAATSPEMLRLFDEIWVQSKLRWYT